MPPPATPKRQSWTEAERHEIQDYAKRHPTEGWRAIKRWYEAQHPAKTLSQSQVSKILHPKRPRGTLDASSVDPNYLAKLNPERKRLRTGKYAELEKALYEWHQEYASQNRGVAATGPLIQEKAADIWKRLRMYEHLEVPKFSAGWLHKWKRRYGIKRRVRHGEGINTSTVIDQDEVMKDAVEDPVVEAQIINTCQRIPKEEPESASEPPAPLTHTAALEALETLTLFKLQTGTMDPTTEELFYRERRRIEDAQTAERARQRQRVHRTDWKGRVEGAQTAGKGRQRQRTLDEFMGPVGRD